MATDGLIRCSWAGTDPLNLRHHDEEWGVPSRDRRHLFELLTLEIWGRSFLGWSMDRPIDS